MADSLTCTFYFQWPWHYERHSLQRWRFVDKKTNQQEEGCLVPSLKCCLVKTRNHTASCGRSHVLVQSVSSFFTGSVLVGQGNWVIVLLVSTEPNFLAAAKYFLEDISTPWHLVNFLVHKLQRSVKTKLSMQKECWIEIWLHDFSAESVYQT